MIRCKCGVWTSYGLTCVNCRNDNNYRKPPAEALEEVVEAIEEDDELEEAED
jgi:hypothetical protein